MSYVMKYKGSNGEWGCKRIRCSNHSDTDMIELCSNFNKPCLYLTSEKTVVAIHRIAQEVKTFL